MKLTVYLLLANVIVFVLQVVVGGFTEFFALTPVLALNGYYWQFITYMFLHGGYFHLFINMFVLLMFGSLVEETLGRNKFALLYLLAGLGSAGLHIALTGISDILMLGASGAVFGLLAAYGILYPRNWIIMFPGIPMPAGVAVVVFGIVEFLLGYAGFDTGIANFGHLGGLITGVLFMLVWRSLYGKPAPKGYKEEDIEFIWE